MHHQLRAPQTSTVPTEGSMGAANEGKLECRSCRLGKEVDGLLLSGKSKWASQRQYGSRDRPGVQQERRRAMRTAGLCDAACLCCSTFVRGVLPAPLPPLQPRGLQLRSKNLQCKPNARRPGLGQGEEVELWLVAVFWFLFQFNLQACLFLAVRLGSFKAIPEL